MMLFVVFNHLTFTSFINIVSDIFQHVQPVICLTLLCCYFSAGLLFIPNPFTVLGQRYWVCRCLKDFTCPPQKLNLDAHGDLEDGQRWWDMCMK